MDAFSYKLAAVYNHCSGECFSVEAPDKGGEAPISLLHPVSVTRCFGSDGLFNAHVLRPLLSHIFSPHPWVDRQGRMWSIGWFI